MGRDGQIPVKIRGLGEDVTLRVPHSSIARSQSGVAISLDPSTTSTALEEGTDQFFPLQQKITGLNEHQRSQLDRYIDTGRQAPPGGKLEPPQQAQLVGSAGLVSDPRATPKVQMDEAVTGLTGMVSKKTAELKADPVGRVRTSMRTRFRIPFNGLKHGDDPPSENGELEWYIMNRILVDIGLADAEAWAVLGLALPEGLDYVPSVKAVSAGDLAATVLKIANWNGDITEKEQLAIAQKVYTMLNLGNPERVASSLYEKDFDPDDNSGWSEEQKAYEEKYEVPINQFDKNEPEEVLWVLKYRISHLQVQDEEEAPEIDDDDDASITYAKNALIKLADFLKGAQDALQFQAAKSVNQVAFLTDVPCTAAVTSSDKMGVLAHVFASVEVAAQELPPPPQE